MELRYKLSGPDGGWRVEPLEGNDDAVAAVCRALLDERAAQIVLNHEWGEGGDAQDLLGACEGLPSHVARAVGSIAALDAMQRVVDAVPYTQHSCWPGDELHDDECERDDHAASAAAVAATAVIGSFEFSSWPALSSYCDDARRLLEAEKKYRMTINLTQHAATPEQHAQGVVDVRLEQRATLTALLTFAAAPTAAEIFDRAAALAALAQRHGAQCAMIGGAPYLMGALEIALNAIGIEPVYSFSVRESVETPDGNGGVRKVAVFRHAGFVAAATPAVAAHEFAERLGASEARHV